MSGTPARSAPPAPAAAFMLPGVKLFASGVYRGKSWPAWRIRQMAANARALGPSGAKLLLPPAAPGHEDDSGWQEFVGEVDAVGPPVRTDEPAAGWVDPDSVRAVPDPVHRGHLILTGDIVNVPPAMAAKIESGEYKFGSSEVYDDFLDDFGKAHGKTLRKFSYLGGEVPQVKRLGPLPMPVPMRAPKYFSERAAGVFVRERRERRGDTIHTYAETVSMDRTQMMAALQAAMPGLSQATLDALQDEQLADLVKNLPSPGAAAPAAPAAAAAPAMAFAEGEEDTPSREDMIADLVEMGEDQAELEAMPADELAAMWEEMTADDGEPAPAEQPVETMGDPATMPREEMVAEMVAMGQDAAALEAMPEEELRAMYAQLAGQTTAPNPTPAPAAPVAAMSDRARRNKPKTNPGRRSTMSDSARLGRKAKRLERELDESLRAVRIERRQAKKADAEAFCDRLVIEGRITRAQVQTLALPALLPLDNLRRVHKFTDGGQTRSLSAYELKKRQLAAMPVVVRFGEKLGGSGGAAAPADGAAEVAKVRQFAETLSEGVLKAGNYKSREQFVERFSELRKKDSSLTAQKYLGT